MGNVSMKGVVNNEVVESNVFILTYLAKNRSLETRAPLRCFPFSTTLILLCGYVLLLSLPYLKLVLLSTVQINHLLLPALLRNLVLKIL